MVPPGWGNVRAVLGSKALPRLPDDKAGDRLGGGGALASLRHAPSPDSPRLEDLWHAGQAFMNLSTLIICPGHAIFVGSTGSDVFRTDCWRGLFPAYVETENEIGLYVEHIKSSVRVAAEQEDALLVFSGGETRPGTEPGWDEAGGYRRVAAAHGWWQRPEVALRVELEQYARDSLENTTHSVHVFCATAGAVPRRIIVVGFRFKAERYRWHLETLQRHHAALGLPEIAADVSYIGVNDPPADVLEKSRVGERLTLEAFRRHPLGHDGGALERKRGERDPHRRGNPYY